MSVETRVLSQKPVSLGCYRRRLAFLNDGIVYSNGSALYSEADELLLNLQSQIYDILVRSGKLYATTDTGDVLIASDNNTQSAKQLSSVSKLSGFFSAIESTQNYIAAANDITHSIRILDPEQLKTVGKMQLPGMINCFSSSSGSENDLLCTADDRTLSLIDTRDMKCVCRSNVISSMPVCLLSSGGKMMLCCEDRKIRIFDQRKLKSPIYTTKPTTKNGAVALFANENGEEVISVGCDEGMTLAVISEDVGQFKRGKYLAETPWTCAPVLIDGKLSLLTRGGILHQFTDPFAFLKSQKEAKPDDVNEE